jgi:ENTH domain
MQVVQELSSNLIVIEKLQSFQYKDPNMRDHGENVRHRAKQLCELVMDPERVREERKKVEIFHTFGNECIREHPEDSRHTFVCASRAPCSRASVHALLMVRQIALLQAKELKSKYTGVSSDMMRNRLGGSSAGGLSGAHHHRLAASSSCGCR